MNKYDQMPCCGEFRLACTCKPQGKWLTREEVTTLITKHTHQSNEGLSDYTESLDSESMLDEMFGREG